MVTKFGQFKEPKCREGSEIPAEHWVWRHCVLKKKLFYGGDILEDSISDWQVFFIPSLLFEI